MNDMATDVSDLTSVRLGLNYDEALLKDDLSKLKDFRPTKQVGGKHDGGWMGIALHSSAGVTDFHSARRHTPYDAYLPTPALSVVPYIKSILDGIPGLLMSVRVTELVPGAEIYQHTDDYRALHAGCVRLHIPIVRHSDISFIIDDVAQNWMPGQLWYGDFRKRHTIVNRSLVSKISIVIDVATSVELLELFPTQFLRDYKKLSSIIVRPSSSVLLPSHLALDDLEFQVKPASDFQLPFRNINYPANMSLRLHGDKLFLFLEGRSISELLPQDDGSLYIEGWPSYAISLRGERGDSLVMEDRSNNSALPLRLS